MGAGKFEANLELKKEIELFSEGADEVLVGVGAERMTAPFPAICTHRPDTERNTQRPIFFYFVSHFPTGKTLLQAA